MIGYGAVLRLNLFFGNWCYTNMFPNSYIPVSHTFTVIVLTAESILKFINDTRSKIIRNPIFEMKVVTESGLIFEHYLQFTTIKDVFNDFFNLVLVCKDTEPRLGRTRTRSFFSTVRTVSFTTCMSSINLLKYLFIKISG